MHVYPPTLTAPSPLLHRRLCCLRRRPQVADVGSVLFNFQRQGLVMVDASEGEDRVFEAAMDAGAADIQQALDEDGKLASFKVGGRAGGQGQAMLVGCEGVGNIRQAQQGASASAGLPCCYLHHRCALCLPLAIDTSDRRATPPCRC